MVRDASFSFPSAPHLPFSTPVQNASMNPSTSIASSSSQQQPQPSVTGPSQRDNYALSIGPVSLNVDHRVGNTLEAGVDAARDGLKDLFGKVRSRVDGVRLA
ncbi:hypothetical protein JCM10212_002846 [Sporobolomyces blumeae]